jgi:D-sedoheptulose 7-phosphate isomerase
MKKYFADELCSQVRENIDTSKGIIENSIEVILSASEKMVTAVKKGNKIMLCGNGGSASDSQHIAAEFINRFKKERKPLPAIALTTDTSILTSISNDYDFSFVFSKQVEALGKKGDILIAISTSGNARNVLEAVKSASRKGMFTIGLTGDGGGKLKRAVDLCISISSHDTPRIQEAHILVGHLLCDLVEKMLFAK